MIVNQAHKGYVVDKVIVNGQVVAPDQYGNYIYILKTGENIVEVTFKEAK